MCCIGGIWALAVVALGCATRVLVLAESTPSGSDVASGVSRWRRWLRRALLAICGVSFLMLAVPLAYGLLVGATMMPRPALFVVGIVMVGWGVGRLGDTVRPVRPTAGDSPLGPVSVRWEPWLLIAVGAAAVAASFGFPSGP